MPVSKRLLIFLLAMTITSRALRIFPKKTCRPCRWAGEPVTHSEMPREEMPREDSDDEPLFEPVAKRRHMQEEEDHHNLSRRRKICYALKRSWGRVEKNFDLSTTAGLLQQQDHCYPC
jgi:hypothetical protein